MPVKIGHASIDERGKVFGGAAGDQTGKEICRRDWYAKGWNKLIRAKSANVAEKIARAMEQACANDNIGYDQHQRTTLYGYAVAAKWDLSKITTKCETDCSALVAVCVSAAGISVSKDMYTGNEAAVLKNTGSFDILTDVKYLTTDAYLKRGDILLKEGSHTAVVLTNGARAISDGKVEPAFNKDISLKGRYIVDAGALNVRRGAGKNYNIIAELKNGAEVMCYGYYTPSDGTKWLLIEHKGITGYASSKYLKKA